MASVDDFLKGNTQPDATAQPRSAVDEFLAPAIETAKQGTMSAKDVLKGVGAGIGTGIVSPIGTGVRMLSAAIPIAGAPVEQLGKAIQGAGGRISEGLIEQMSPAGQEAARGNVFEGEGLSDLRLADNWGQRAIMGAAQSLPGMLATAPVGGVLAKGASKVLGGAAGAFGGTGATRALLEGAASPVGLGAKAIAAAPTALGYGAAEGVLAGLQNAGDVQREIEQTPVEKLKANAPAWEAAFAATDPSKGTAERENEARSRLAADAASQIAGRTAVSTGGIGALTGGGALGMLARRGVTKPAEGFVKTVLKGAGEEALQETPQSAAEQYIQNLAQQRYQDAAITPGQGVVQAGLTGGVIGGLTGGAFGAGGAALQKVAERKEKPPAAEGEEPQPTPAQQLLLPPPPVIQAGQGGAAVGGGGGIEAEAAQRRADAIYAARAAEDARLAALRAEAGQPNEFSALGEVGRPIPQGTIPTYADLYTEPARLPDIPGITVPFPETGPISAAANVTVPARRSEVASQLAASTFEQQRAQAALAARETEAAAQKTRDLEALQRESRLPAALFDAERQDAVARAAGALEETPNAMQVAMRAAQRGAEGPSMPARSPAATVPFTEQGARRAARDLTARGMPSQVAPHPSVPGRFTLIPMQQHVDEQANAAATSPTNELAQPSTPQKSAGNYPKGHLKVNGLNVSIENPRGSQRTNLDERELTDLASTVEGPAAGALNAAAQMVKDGNPVQALDVVRRVGDLSGNPSIQALGNRSWANVMGDHYGYIRGYRATKDGEPIDVHVGPYADSRHVYVVDQNTTGGKFDEPKVFMSYRTPEQVQQAYDSGFSDGSGPQRRGAITRMSVDQFKGWLNTGAPTKPVAGQVKGATDVSTAGAAAETAVPTVPEGAGLAQPTPEEAGAATGAASATGTTQGGIEGAIQEQGATREVPSTGGRGETESASSGRVGSSQQGAEAAPAGQAETAEAQEIERLRGILAGTDTTREWTVADRRAAIQALSRLEGDTPSVAPLPGQSSGPLDVVRYLGGEVRKIHTNERAVRQRFGDAAFNEALDRRWIVGSNQPSRSKNVIAPTLSGRAALEAEDKQVATAVTEPELSGRRRTPVAEVTEERRTGAERRADLATRKKVEEMTPEEMRVALHTDDLTGLLNRRAYDEGYRSPFQASLDLDALAWINDNLGHESGDSYLRAFGHLLAEEAQSMRPEVRAYRVGGDEFRLEGRTRGILEDLLERVGERAAQEIEVTATLPDGSTITKKGVGFSYGIAKDFKTADEVELPAHKAERTRQGLRPERKAEPPGVVRKPAEGVAPAVPETAEEVETIQQPAQTAPTTQEGQHVRQGQRQEAETTGQVLGAEGEKAQVVSPAAEREWIRASIESLIKRKRVADQIGRRNALDKVVARAKDYLAGKDIKPGVFITTAKAFREDAETQKLISDIGERIKTINKEAAKAAKVAEKAAETTTAEAETKQKEPATTPEQVPVSEKPTFVPNEGWETHLIKARVYANALGVTWWGKDSVGDIVARIKARLAVAGLPVAEAETAKEEAEQLAKESAKARRGVERTIFNRVLDDLDGIPEAPPKETVAFIELAKRHINTALDEIDRDGTPQEREAVAELRKPFAIPKAFYDALERRAQRRWQLAQIDKNRDPQIYRDALASAGADANIGDDPQMVEAFKTGFDHALKGKTRSTLTSPLMGVATEGYDAARRWINTDEGRAWYEGKRGQKLVNTGIDLRRWYEQSLKALSGAKEGTPEQKLALIEKHTSRADAMRPALALDATPGAQRWVEQLRGELLPFKQWFVVRDRLRGPLYYNGKNSFGITDTQKILQFLEGSTLNEDTVNISQEGESRIQARALEVIQDAARRYVETMRTMADALSGAHNVGELAEKYDALMSVEGEDRLSDYGEKITGFSIASFYPGRYSSGGRITADIKAGEMQASPTITKATPLRRPKLDRVERTGREDYRQGRNITPQELKEKFGLASVGFGKWVAAKADQDHVNYAHDAFMDLATVLGIEPKAIGLGGTLHITFGALGHGRHAAHFSAAQPAPDGSTVPVINITNTKGDGTIAHEWTHALDSNLGNGRISTHPAVKEVIWALRNLFDHERLNEIPSKFIEGGWSYKQVSRGDRLKQALYALDRGNYGRASNTQFDKDAKNLDGGSVDGYWSRPHELLARAAEAWVFDQLGKTESNYLVSDWVAPGKVSKEAGFRGRPYPIEDERARIGRFMRALFDSITWTESGPRIESDERLKALVREERNAFDQAKEDLRAQLPALHAAWLEKQKAEAIKRVSVQASEEEGARLAQEAKRREEERARLEMQLRAQEAAKPDPAIPETKQATAPLTRDELESLFDQAEAELAEENQEEPGGVSPGDVLVDAATPAAAEEPTTQKPTARPKTKGAATVAATASTEQPESVRRAIAETTKLGVTGIDEAMKGLVKLFGGGNGRLMSFPGAIDEDTYASAKPHFEASLDAFQKAGRTLKDLLKHLIQLFGSGIRPYALRFAEERGLGLELNPEVSHASAEQTTVSQDDPVSDGGTGPVVIPNAPGTEPPGRRGGQTGGGGVRVVSERGRGEPGGDLETTGTAVPEAGTGADNAQQPTLGSGAGASVGVPPGGESRRVAKDGPPNYSAAPGALTREGSWRRTAERNLDIVELVKRLESEGRAATPEEQQQLALYTGFGASEIRNKLFPVSPYGKREVRPDWAPEDWRALAHRAAALFTPEELNTLLQSTQYAHYTSEPVTRSIWSALERMGFNGGRILEPGMGHGNFPITAPAELMGRSSYTGIEMDHLTAAIAHQLLPRENVLRADFVEQRLPNNFFDVAIGNPPFANITITQDPAYRRQRFSLHDYFFAKSIDKVRPGGLLVFVTSRYTMDKKGDRARAYLAERADLLGAIRLPQTAFKENAGTEVVTDVLFLRKRAPGEAPGGQKWLGLKDIKTRDGAAVANEYFADHPEMVLGEFRLSGNRDDEGKYISSLNRIGDLVVTPRRDESIETSFANAVEKLPEGVYTQTQQADPDVLRVESGQRDLNPDNRKEGGVYVSEKGDLLRTENGVGVPLAEVEKLTEDDVAWVRDYVGLRDVLKTAQQDQLNDGDWEASLAQLNKLYNKFVKKHGQINAHTLYERTTTDEDGEKTTVTYLRFKNKNRFKLDVEFPLVQSLEKITSDGDVVKGPFLLGRTISKPTLPKIETVQDALMVSLDQRGILDLDHVAELSGKTRQEVVDTLGDAIFEAPSGGWQMADEYLSGDVITKLEEAEAAAQTDGGRYERNVKALLLAQPKPLTHDKITVSLGVNWIPESTVQRFAIEHIGLPYATVSYNDVLHQWSVGGGEVGTKRSARSVAHDWGVTGERTPAELLESALNNEDVTIRKTGADKKSYVDKESTAAAEAIVKRMREDFSTWIWTDADRAQNLLALYNRKFNNLAPRKFDGSHLSLPGLSMRYSLYDHQKRAIWRVIQTGNTYLAHAVGSGKTLQMIVSGMEQKRLGFIKKPMYVVPNHMLEQFASEFLDAYPSANIMVADEENFHTSNRKRFVAQAALNDPDAIVITHTAFQLLKTKPETTNKVVDKVIAELVAASQDEKDSKTRSRLEKRIEQLKRKYAGAIEGAKKDDVVFFEDMGADFVYYDEAHMARKLEFATNRGAVKGITPDGSTRALDLYIKTRWLDSQRPGRSMVFASGTPITNTMAELFTVMRFLDEPSLEVDNLSHFDEWASMFGESAKEFERNAAGGYEFVERFSRFRNIPELMKRVRSFMDVITMSELGTLVKRPDLITGQPQNVVSPEPDTSREYRETELGKRLEESRAWKPTKNEPNNPDPVINIITDGRLAAIDPRFVVRGASGAGSKLEVMIDAIIDQQKAIKETTFTDPLTGKTEPIKGATQIVFSPVGFGEMVAQNRGFDVKAHVTKRLKAAGFKGSEIAWMSDANSHAKKHALFRAMRAGEVKVLFGSPGNMGTGVNVQSRLKVLHYLSPPWFPADVEQPHGRILRQGNRNPDVAIYWYATDGTYDSTMWSMVARKSKFIEQAMSGDDSVRSMEDVSESSLYAMAAALSAGDERAIRMAELQGDVERLERLRGAHANEQSTLRSQQRQLQSDIDFYRKTEQRHKAAAQDRGEVPYPVTLQVGKTTLDKAGEIGQALIEGAQKALSGGSGTIGQALGKLTVHLNDQREIRSVVDGKQVKTSYAKLSVKMGDVEYPFTNDMSAEDFAAADATGIGRRFANALYQPEKLGAEAADRWNSDEEELKAINSRIGAPFANEAQLAQKIAELAQLKQELTSEGKEVPSEEALGAIDEKKPPVTEAPAETGGEAFDLSFPTLFTESEAAALTSRVDVAEMVRTMQQDMRRRSGKDLEFRAAKRPDTALGRAAEALSKLFGHRVVWIQNRTPHLLNFNGKVGDTAPGVIFINADTQRPELSVAGHELLHQLRRARPDLYDSMAAQLHQFIKALPADQFRLALAAKYKQAGLRISDEKINEELIADIVGDRFLEPAFMDRFMQHLDAADRPLASRIAKSIRDFLSAVLTALRGNKLMQRTGAELISDLDRVHGIVADHLAQWAKDTGTTTAAPMSSIEQTAISGQEQPLADTAGIRSALSNAFGEEGVSALQRSGLLNIIAASEAPFSIGKTSRAAYYDGKAYLFSDRLNAQDAPAVLLHELGEHHGLADMLGQRGWIALRNKLNVMARREGSLAAQTWANVKEAYPEFSGLNNDELASNDRFIHEVLASLGEHAAFRQGGFWRDLVAAVQRFLLRTFGISSGITEDTVADLVRGSLARVIRGAENLNREDLIENPLFSLRRRIDQIASAFEGRVRAYFDGGRKAVDVRIADNTPASLQVFGWEDTPIDITSDVLAKMHDYHGITVGQFGQIPYLLRRPAMVFGDVKNSSLVFVGENMRQGTPGLVAVRPSTGARSQRALIVTGYEPDMGWAEIANRIKRGELIYRDSNFGAPEIVKEAMSFAQKKYSREHRSLPRELLHGRGASVLRSAYKILGQSDLVKWENTHWGENPLFSEIGGTEAPMSSIPLKRTEMPEFAKSLTPQQQATLRKVGMIHDTPTLAGRVTEMMTDFRKKFVQGAVDQYAPLKDLDPKVYMLARLSQASDGGVESLLLYGKPYVDADGALDIKIGQGGGFIDAMRKLNGEHDRFFAWVAAQRAEELKNERWSVTFPSGATRHFKTEQEARDYARTSQTLGGVVVEASGRENLLTDDDISFLKDTNQGNMPDGTSRVAAYAEALKSLQEFNKATLDIAEASGLIDAQSRPLWESQFYVPFYRVLEDGVTGPTIKSGLLNQYAFKKLKGGTENLNDLFKNTLTNWSHLLSASAKNRAAKAAVEAAEKAGIAIEAPEATIRQMGKSLAEKAAAFMDNGVKRWFLIDDPYVMDAISSLESPSLGPIIKPFQKAKRLLSFGVTLTPTYKIANLLRDSIAVVGQAPINYNPLSNLVQGWKATYKGGQTYASMLAGGGMFRYGTLLEGDRAEHTKRIVEAGIKDFQVLDTKEKVKAVFQKVWDAYQELGDRSENINRAALYEQLRAKGASHLEASYEARDVLDFGLQGKWGAVRLLTQVVPFANARLQGLYKLGRAAQEDKVRFGIVVGSVMLASLALMLMQEDDDDFKKIEDWQRDAYWNVKIGGTMYLIPKPFEIGALGTLAERTWELAFNKEMTTRRFRQRMGDMFANTFAMSPVPQLIKPLVDVYSNKESFTGRAIESAGMERLRPEDRMTGRTSETAKILAQAGLPEPSQLLQGRYEQLSPVQIDSLMRGYFGSMALGANMVIDALFRPIMGRAERPAGRLEDTPILGRFVRDLPSGQSRYITEMYDNARQIEQAYASYRDALKRGDVTRARELYADESDKIKLHQMAAHAQRRIGELNREIKRTEDSYTLSADQKRERIDYIRSQQDKMARAARLVPR